MKWTHNIRNLRDRRRSLRKDQTEEESMLWFELRNSKLGVKFKRQHSIGGYIADFYCPKCNLVIEIDGPIHETPENAKNDQVRDAYLREMKCTIMRFKNIEIQTEIESVIGRIKKQLQSHG